jgi:hypothetical protein
MDKEKLKQLIDNVKELIEELESEIYSDKDSYLDNYEFSSPPSSYDEVFDDDGYCD